MSNLYQEWIEAKAAEAEAIRRRRTIEDILYADLNLAESFEGSKTLKPDGYKMTVSARMNRKIDSDMLQEVAAESGLSDHLSSLFSWKPSINMKIWKEADQRITNILSKAITTTPGRPTFKIIKEEK